MLCVRLLCRYVLCRFTFWVIGSIGLIIIGSNDTNFSLAGLVVDDYFVFIWSFYEMMREFAFHSFQLRKKLVISADKACCVSYAGIRFNQGFPTYVLLICLIDLSRDESWFIF